MNELTTTDAAQTRRRWSWEPTNRRHFLIATLVVLPLLLTALVTVPYATLQLTAVPSFVPVYNAAVVVLHTVTVVLLLAEFNISRERALICLIAAYIYSAVLAFAHGLSFPDAFVPGVLFGNSQTTAWLWLAWHVPFPCFFIFYGILRGSESKSPHALEGGAPPSAIFFAIAASIGLALLFIAICASATAELPALMNGAAYVSSWTNITLFLGWLLHLIAIAVVFRNTGLSRRLDLWAVTILAIELIDLSLSAILITGRFELGFYAGRFYGLIGSSLLLSGLLYEAMGHNARLGKAQAALVVNRRELSESEQRYRELANSLPLIVWESNAGGRLRFVSDAYRVITGKDPSEAVGKEWLFKLPPDDQERIEQAWAAAHASGSPYEVEFRLALPEQPVRWILSRGVPVKSHDGTILRWVGSEIDITHKKQTEDHMRLLMREVNHRSKNILAVVQALARQSATDDEGQQAVSRLSERLQSLAASQDLLVKSEWKGVSMEDLVRSQLAHFFGSDADRISIDGPLIELAASAAQNLGLALHELGTNAGKYGSLSQCGGKLSITWFVEQDTGRLILNWQESGGPPAAHPRKAGFGTFLTTRLTEQAFSGNVQVSFGATGFSWRLEAPLTNFVS